jgi:RHS repeat-associated protein
MTETPPTAGTAFSFSWDTVDGGGTPLDIDDGASYYIYGVRGTSPIEQIPVASTNTPSYIASSPTGVQVVFSQTGTVQEKAVYSTYGTQVLEGGTSDVTPFGFQGSYTDPSGLLYLINRYYDPATDQFLSVDPALSVTLEPYSVEGDDPLNSMDPLGFETVAQFLKYCSTKAGHAYCAALKNTPKNTANYQCLTGNTWACAALGTLDLETDIGGQLYFEPVANKAPQYPGGPLSLAQIGNGLLNALQYLQDGVACVTVGGLLGTLSLAATSESGGWGVVPGAIGGCGLGVALVNVPGT